MTDLLERLGRLPGLGPRSSQRIAFHLLLRPAGETKKLGEALEKMKASVRFCASCGNLTNRRTCSICEDPGRDHGIICVVEEPKDVVAFEETGSYRGGYHVLMGKISPLDGVGPEDLRIGALVARIRRQSPREVIVATGSDPEGETTAFYLARVLKPLGVKVTRLAAGIPLGTAIDFVDPGTLTRALEGRRDL
ncbi:MAG TPA: recombination mediator RecR [bacterium]|nr:recombination mediator RecR [bacterium]HPQ65809.1 recombination mediator RecR [bacterium]